MVSGASKIPDEPVEKHVVVALAYGAAHQHSEGCQFSGRAVAYRDEEAVAGNYLSYLSYTGAVWCIVKRL